MWNTAIRSCKGCGKELVAVCKGALINSQVNRASLTACMSAATCSNGLRACLLAGMIFDMTRGQVGRGEDGGWGGGRKGERRRGGSAKKGVAEERRGKRREERGGGEERGEGEAVGSGAKGKKGGGMGARGTWRSLLNRNQLLYVRSSICCDS